MAFDARIMEISNINIITLVLEWKNSLIIWRINSILVRNNEKPCILFEQCVPLPLTESQHTVDTLAVSISVCA